MASTITFYTGDGATTDFTVPFDYLAKKFVRVSLGVTLLKGGDYGDTSKDYYFLDKTKVRLKVPPQEGEVLTIRRYTSSTDRVVSFKDASVLKATDLDVSSVQTIHIAEEARDIINDTLTKGKEGNWDAKGNRIINVGTPVADSDAVTYGAYKTDTMGVYQAKLNAEAARDAAKVSETNAKASEVNAKESEVTAKASAGTAVSAAKHADAVKADNQAILEEARQLQTEIETSEKNAYDNAVIATQKADEAKVSETNAKVSETNAKASEVEAKRQADLAKGYAEDSASGQLNADWEVTDPKSKAFIKNKPTLGALASKDSIAYSEITGTPPEQDLSGLATKTELQTGLAGKADASHTHTSADVTDLDVTISNALKPYATTDTVDAVKNSLARIPLPSVYVWDEWRRGTEWYRRWSDGSIDQGGHGTGSACTFSRPFSTVDYTFIVQPSNGETGHPDWMAAYENRTSRTRTGTGIAWYYAGDQGWDWYASGY